jgi:hypothetical protein
MNPDGRVTFRPVIPMRVLWAVGPLVFGLPAIGFVSDPMPSDSGWWFFLGMSLALAALGARGLLIRVVADEHGVRLVNIFSSRRYTWDSIDRFELSPGTRSPAMLVTKTGRHRSLAISRSRPVSNVGDAATTHKTSSRLFSGCFSRLDPETASGRHAMSLRRGHPRAGSGPVPFPA